MQSIGGKLLSLRKSKGFTLDQFALEIGVSKPSLIKYEKGEIQIIPLGVAIKMAKVLGENFGQLFEIENSVTVTSEAAGELEKLRARLKELEKRIEEKDLVINSLNLNRKFFVKTLIRYMEDDSRVNFYWIAKQGYQYAKTEEHKNIVDEIIRREEDRRKGMYDYFINEGLMTKDEIEQVHQSINDSYKKLNWENAFKAIFTPGSKLIPGKPIDFMG